MSKVRIVDVQDPELGRIRTVYDEDGTELASASQSPVQSDGSTIWFDESQVFFAAGQDPAALMPMLLMPDPVPHESPTSPSVTDRPE